jgi:hypothetical protein
MKTSREENFNRYTFTPSFLASRSWRAEASGERGFASLSPRPDPEASGLITKTRLEIDAND